MKQGIPRTKPVIQPIITVHIVTGDVSEHQEKLFRAFWARIIAECQRELKAESEAKK